MLTKFIITELDEFVWDPTNSSKEVHLS